MIATQAPGRPLTAKENTVWQLEQDVPGTAANTIAAVLRIFPDPERLRTALGVLLRDHPGLRTVVAGDDRPIAVTAPESVDLVETDDLDSFLARRFDLAAGPLIRFALGRHGLAVAAHHLVFDSASAGPLLQALGPIYHGTAQELVTAPVLVPLAADIEHWAAMLRDVDPAGAGLPVARPDPAKPTLAASHVEHTLSQDAAEAVSRMRKSLRAPEAVILLAAFQALLGHHGAGPDVLVGTPVDQRGREFAGTVGYHVGLVLIRSTVDLQVPFGDLVRTCRDGFFDALSRASTPIDAVLPYLPSSGSWRTLPVRHIFNYVPARAAVDFGGIPTVAEPLEANASRHDLELRVYAGARPRLLLGHRTEILDHEWVALFALAFDAFLVAVERGGAMAQAFGTLAGE